MIQTQLINFLQHQLGNKPAVIGLSGGIDSTVVAYLVAQAISPNQVYGLILPSQTNQPSDQSDAEVIAQKLGIHYETILIDPLVTCFKESTTFYSTPLTLGNLKARIRMSLLYGKANQVNGLVVGTGNKSELLSGYFTKYGDGGVDLLPLGDLYKTQVWKLAQELGVPNQIIDKPPTAGLWPGQTDEAELGLSYQTLDTILEAMQQHQDLGRFPITQVQRVQELRQRAQHKLTPAVIAQLT